MSKRKTVDLSDSVAARGRIFDRAKTGDADSMTALRELLDRTPEVRAGVVGMLEDLVECKVIGSIANDNAVFEEGVHRRLDDLRKELGGPSPNPIERLCVDRIALCWLQVHEADLRAARPEGRSIAQANFESKRQDRAHKRLLSAIKTLATIRKLALPTLQINVGENQLNVANAGVDA